LAIKNDSEFDRLCQDVHIFSGGVLPSIEPKSAIRSRKKTAGYTRAESMPVIGAKDSKQTPGIEAKPQEFNSENVETSPEHPRAKLSAREKKTEKRERGKLSKNYGHRCCLFSNS
jgi:hypothetical protein